jgi:hypothetical protein
MKVYLISAHADGRIDPTTMERLYQHIPGHVHSISDADVVLVAISHYEDYRFGHHLEKIGKKPWAMIDYMEYHGQCEEYKTHLFGVNHEIAWNLHSNPEWEKLHNFCKSNPPAIYFKRELFNDISASIAVSPVEWPCNLPAWDIESESAFNTRPFEVSFVYGISHCSRPMLHGDMLKRSCELGYEVINSMDHVDAKIHAPGRKWIAVHTPHTHRIHINGIVLRQAQSKLSVGLRGAGVKTFRHGELVHTVPAIHGSNLKWSFPWIADENCIFLDRGHITDFDALCAALERKDLHSIYVRAQENMAKYRVPYYVDNHILPSLRNVI